MKIDHLIQEALPLSTAKKYVKSWDPNFHKEVFEKEPRKDKNAYRIYLPFESEPRKQVKIPDELLNYLQSAIPNKPYTTDADNYMQGLAYEVTNPTRKLGIGKMLARSEGSEKDTTRKAQLQALKRAFDADPQRAATRKADKLIVISRHPYDVAGMSTDRGWGSCMNLVDGINRHYVLRDVKQGSIIAYLINADDVNVNKPLARILIKPYQQKGNPKNLAMMGDQVYGTAPPEFKQQVDAWVNERYNADKTGLFCLAKGLYRDEIPQQMQLFSDEQFAQAPRAQIVTMAVRDKQLWPRVVKLRSDADEILWQVAEKADSRAAKFIKHIDLERFKKAFQKRAQILARLHTQTPDMVSYAIAERPDAVVYVRNRTPAQHQLVQKLLTKNFDLIKRVHEPTPEQIQYAISKDQYLVDWAIEKHPDLVTRDQAARWLEQQVEYGDLEDSQMNWIKSKHPDILADPDMFKFIARNQPSVLWDNLKLGDADVLNLIRWAPVNRFHRDEWLNRNVPRVLPRLSQIPTEDVPTVIMTHIKTWIPDLLGAFPDLKVDELKPLVKKHPTMIAHWKDPDPELVATAILNDQDEELEGKFQEDKYEPAWQKVIKINPNLILMVQKPSQQLIKQAALHPKLEYYMASGLMHKNPDVANQVRLLKRYPKLIDIITAPSLAAQMAAVNANPEMYELIRPMDRHPAVKAYVAAYRKEMRKPE
jgi:hypothetical protein